MHINEKSFLRFLRNKWFIPVFVGIIILPSAFLFFTYQDKAYLHNVTNETLRFLRLQVMRYNKFEARSATVDMTLTLDRAKGLVRALQDSPKLLHDTEALKDYAYAQRLDGLIVLDDKKNVEAEYFIDINLKTLVLQKAKTANVDNIAQYPFRSYIDQVKDEHDDGIYSYAIAGRLDKPGYVLCYRKESTRADADSQSYLDGLFGSYGFELNGTVMITDGKRVLSSNRQEFAKRLLNDLIPDARKQVKEEGDGLYSVRYKGETFYGVVDSYRGYRLSAFFPESAVYANRTRNMIYVILVYALGCMLFMYFYFQVSRARELSHQQQLETIAAEAQRASIAKTDFLRRMSHDIRTPLNGILGLLEMADYYADNTEKLKELRSKVLENTHYLLDLSNDVLEMNKIESGEIHLAQKCFDVVQLAQNVGMMTEAQAKMRDLKCERSIKVEHPYVIGSPVHVRQILANLTSNAVKYNKIAGTITLAVRELRCENNKVWLEFTCADTGIGMSEEFQKHAFDLFAQENNEARTSYLGTGLGLAIVKNLTELMGGTLSFTSKKGEGTTFKVVLPFGVSQKPCEAQGEQETANISLKGMKVLLVEDNALNMKIEEFMLEREGAVITQAFNGQEAVNIFADSEPGTFDIILMDIMMPVMDGLTATRTIRALHHEDARTIPIIALSANAFAEDKEESKNAGFTGHLAKPLEAQKLFSAMRKYLRR